MWSRFRELVTHGVLWICRLWIGGLTRLLGNARRGCRTQVNRVTGSASILDRNHRVQGNPVIRTNNTPLIPINPLTSTQITWRQRISKSPRHHCNSGEVFHCLPAQLTAY